MTKPVVIIGNETIDQLRAGQEVELEPVMLLPASDLSYPACQTHLVGQMMPKEPTPEILRAFDIAAERIDQQENAPIHQYRREVYLTMLEIAATDKLPSPEPGLQAAIAYHEAKTAEIWNTDKSEFSDERSKEFGIAWCIHVAATHDLKKLAETPPETRAEP